jgi:hypothetical protein
MGAQSPIVRMSQVIVTVRANDRGRVLFPDVPNLKSRMIAGLECWGTDAQDVLPTNQLAIPVGAGSAASNITVSLSDAEGIRHKDVPLSRFVPSLNLGMWWPFEPFVVNWQTSYITVQAAPAGNYGVAFFVHYL